VTVTGYNTSRVFEAARKVKARLIAQSWPAHPTTGTVPQVALCEPDWTEQFEVVWVVPQIGDDSAITWRSMPNGRDEQFNILIQISTLDLADEDAVLARVEALADVVQRAFYDDATAVTPPNNRIKPLDIAEAVLLEGVGQVAFAIVPAPHEVYRAVCEIRYRLQFRI